MAGSSDWIRAKAGAYRAAWKRVYGAEPSLHNTTLALCVAWHETQCGDAWPGEYNWGACTLRSLNAEEYAALARTVEASIEHAGLTKRGEALVWRGRGYAWKRTLASGKTEFLPLNAGELLHATTLTPSVAKGVHEGRARAAQAAIIGHALPLPSAEILGQYVPRAAVHCDSSPSIGPYFTWFAAFDDDVAGAEYFIRLLTLKKDRTFKRAKSVLERDGYAETDLAEAMYGAGYFTGFHKPELTYERKDGSAASGARMNIEAYAQRIRSLMPSVRTALVGFRSDPSASRETIGLGEKGADVAHWQRIIGAHPDGDFGPVTHRMTCEWQLAHGLKGDGVVGPKTWAAAEARA